MNFETWKEFYQWGWASKAQIAQAVQQGILTDAQYQEIVGSPYPEAKPVEPAHPAIQPATPEAQPASSNTPVVPEAHPATQPAPVTQPANNVPVAPEAQPTITPSK